MTTATRIVRTATLCGLGLLLPFLAHGQPNAPSPTPGDTLYTAAPTALWASADLVVLAGSLPPKTQLIVEEVQDQRLRVRSDHGTGWVSRSALDSGRRVIRHSPPGGGTAGARPSWRAPLMGGRRHAIAIPRLAIRRGRADTRIVSVLLSNRAPQTVTAVYLNLALYDRGPDSTAEHTRRWTVRATGPIDPRTLASYDFRMPEDVHRTCAGVRWVRVRRLDGTTITARLDRGTRSRGGIPYSGDDCLRE